MCPQFLRKLKGGVFTCLPVFCAVEMAKYQRLPGSEDELDDLEVTTVSGKLYSRAKVSTSDFY